MRLEQISEREYGIKQEFKKQSQNYVLAEEEINEMKEFKQKLLAQVESLLYLDQHMSFDPGRLVNEMTFIEVSEEDMAKISFLRQQDITKICEKISSVTLRVKKKQGELDVMQARLEGVKMSWIGARE